MALVANRSVTYARVVGIALPVVLSNATVPIQGAIDTAIIGNLGDESYLAAVALAAGTISLLFAAFNFLQFGAGGLAAQALGAGNTVRVMNVLARGIMIAFVIAALLILFRHPIGAGTMLLYEGSARAEELALVYVLIRIWAAPAELANYAILGWFTGQEMTRRLFEIQIVTSIANIALTLGFVYGFGMDVDGVALGTAIASYLGFCFALWRVRARIGDLLPDGWTPDWTRILNPSELVAVMRLNGDIMIRTLLLVGSFTWMTRLGSLQGDAVLAANGILMTLFHITAYGLDGFAIAVESLVGQAKGARDRQFLRRAVVISSISAYGLAAALSLLLFAVQEPLIRFFTNVEEVREIARTYYFWGALIPLAGVGAFQMDGIFVGATEGRAMRNAMILSAAIYFPVSWWAMGALGNHGIWAALVGWLLLRGLTLLAAYPKLEDRAAEPDRRSVEI